jgi:hypothetical protein
VQASDRYPATLLAAFSAVWLGLAISPSYRQDWLQALGLASGDGAPTGRNHYDRLVHFAYGMLVLPAAEAFGGDLGAAYLGTQGDEWDA